MSRELPRLPRALLHLVLPAERREEFIGDLLEEAALREAKHGAGHADRWLWTQVVHSWPSLVVARLRRGPAAVAVAAPAGVPAVFLADSRWVPRSLAVGVSVALHLVLFGYLAIRGIWTVEELPGSPIVEVTFWKGWLPSAPVQAFSEAKPTVAREKPTPRVSKPTPTTRPVTVALIQSPPTTGTHAPDATGSGTGTGNPTARPGDGPCPAGDGRCAADHPPQRVLPPRVGEKSCVSCTPPQLPPAYLRLGNTYQVMVRICVNKQGGVDSVKVLQGLGGAADDSVVNTVAGWRFTPYQIDGRPVPFCYATRFVFSAL